MGFGPFWGSMTSQKGSRFYNLNFLTSSSAFLPQNTQPMHNFRFKQSFYRVFWYFRWFSGHFGSFWGSVTSQKGSSFSNFDFFSPQKDCPYTFLDPKDHFIEFAGLLGDFRTILGHFRGPWRHRRGKDFIILYFWLYHRFSHPKILTYTHF